MIAAKTAQTRCFKALKFLFRVVHVVAPQIIKTFRLGGSTLVR